MCQALLGTAQLQDALHKLHSCPISLQHGPDIAPDGYDYSSLSDDDGAVSPTACGEQSSDDSQWSEVPEDPPWRLK